MYGYPPNLPPPGLAYASAGVAGRSGESGFGIASIITCIVTVLCSMVWSFGYARLTGHVFLLWLFGGMFVIWGGCGFAFLMAIVGMLQKSRGQRWAKHGMWLCVLIGFVPIIVIQIATTTAR
ncbi:MAG TPA: hypothetical protein VFB66_10850 [Tepidisphaeraceae bacterium]|nr:hypothetical protein [Tepidisphaeraceae bacterium]